MDETVIKGPATVVGDHITADFILPVRYYFLPPDEMAGHVLEDVGVAAHAQSLANGILVVGPGFGSGTGREAPARALRAAGVRTIIGGPFARVFFRNAINNGILVIDCPEIARTEVSNGDMIAIDIHKRQVSWRQRTFDIQEVPQIFRDIMKAGSLIDYGRSILQSPMKEQDHRN